MGSLNRLEARPLAQLNMTPLIDVMLVLLVMFIITIPLQTHAVKLDLPVSCPTCPAVDPVRNKIVITSEGAILWNGNLVGRSELAANLRRAGEAAPEAELHLQPEAAARFEIVDEVLALAGRSGVSRIGFVGNESYTQF